jgi:glycosyltransferase involved in cell wall biosynthesis
MAAISIVIPAYNEASRIFDVIKEIRQHGYDTMVVVDDASKDRTRDVVSDQGVPVISHMINRGAGAATQTGIDYALQHGADIIVTMDGDGQHDAADIGRLIEPILSGSVDVVLGSRFSERKKGEVPWIRRLYNTIARIVTNLFFDIRVRDSQCGMRAFSRKAAELIRIRTSGFEFASEVIHQLGTSHLGFCEVPIHVRYSEYSLGKGQGFVSGCKTFFKLMLHKLFFVSK